MDPLLGSSYIDLTPKVKLCQILEDKLIKSEKFRDNNHLTGNNRTVVHEACNLNYKTCIIYYICDYYNLYYLLKLRYDILITN